MAPTTREEWWKLLHKHHRDIRQIIEMYNIMEIERFDKYAESMNNEILRSMNKAWWNAPDRPSIHSIPRWSDFCDLLSESYCLEEERDHEI